MFDYSFTPAWAHTTLHSLHTVPKYSASGRMRWRAGAHSSSAAPSVPPTLSPRCSPTATQPQTRRKKKSSAAREPLAALTVDGARVAYRPPLAPAALRSPSASIERQPAHRPCGQSEHGRAWLAWLHGMRRGHAGAARTACVAETPCASAASSSTMWKVYNSLGPADSCVRHKSARRNAITSTRRANGDRQRTPKGAQIVEQNKRAHRPCRRSSSHSAASQRPRLPLRALSSAAAESLHARDGR